MIVLELPYPPTNNTYYRNVNSRTIISAKGRQYSVEVGKMLAGCVPIEGRLSVHIEAYPPDLRRRDLDGIFKGLLDALTKAGFWLDDEQIDDLRIVRREKIKGGKVVLRVTVIGF
jgi:crossover junction endodeoxyribonuclease RusA